MTVHSSNPKSSCKHAICQSTFHIQRNLSMLFAFVPWNTSHSFRKFVLRTGIRSRISGVFRCQARNMTNRHLNSDSLKCSLPCSCSLLRANCVLCMSRYSSPRDLTLSFSLSLSFPFRALLWLLLPTRSCISYSSRS